jgi:hypothetical protein
MLRRLVFELSRFALALLAVYAAYRACIAYPN